MRYRRRNALARALPWLIMLGVLIAVGYVWGEDILYLATGQDIIDDLVSDLASAPKPTATPTAGPIGTPPQGVDTGEQAAPVDEGQLGPDGFPLEPRQHVLKYTVQPGDALFLVAQRFDVHPDTIFWANTETLQDNVHLLHVDVELYILPVNGVYHLSDGSMSVAEIAALYGVTAGDILYSEYNDLADYDSTYVPPAGLRIVVPGGRREYISWRAPIRTGTQSGSANPEGPIHPGSCREVYTGTGGSGSYINPLGETPYRVTNGFNPWHPGVDLAADWGTPIYAAETGVVVFAGWHRDGYGELIILDHGEGWTTYYAHLAKRFVGCGDQVSKGQYIAQMGMSGNATGVHVHFEMRENDVPQNPYQFISIRDVRNPGG
jgi:murein DD-endopeptidase MepM/ murein hydrolase activator NlpD